MSRGMPENVTSLEGLEDMIEEHTTFSWASMAPWFVCLLGALFYCYEYLLRVSPSVMTQELMQTYHLTAISFGNLSSVYYYVYVPMQLFVGLLLDKYGPRRLLTLAVLVCAVGTYFFAAGYSLWVAQIGRFMVGFGSAFAFVGVLKLATIWLPPHRFALVSGFTLALGMMGGMLGDVALTSLVQLQGWKQTCYLAAIVGVLLTFIIYSIVRDENPRLPPAKHLSDLHNVVLIWSEIKKILFNPQIWINGVIGCLLYLSLSAFAELWAIPYLEQASNFKSDDAAAASSMVFLGWAIGGPIMGWFSDFIRQRRLLLTMGSVVSAVLIAVVLYAPNVSARMVMAILFVCGLFSSSQILVFSVSREISPVTLSGTALALTNMMVMIGGLFVPLIGWVLDFVWAGQMVAGARVYSVGAYQLGLSLLPAGLILAALLTLFLRETGCHQQME